MQFVRSINMYALKSYFTTKGCGEHGEWCVESLWVQAG